MNRTMVCMLACLGFVASTAWAADEIRAKTVQFAKGKSSATLKDTIKGRESVDYKLGASAGQTMTVTLKPSNRSTYFNVMAPGDDSAIFIGSTSGNTFSGNLPKTGNYVVRVYLMSNAGRRNETSNYSIDFRIAGTPAEKP